MSSLRAGGDERGPEAFEDRRRRLGPLRVALHADQPAVGISRLHPLDQLARIFMVGHGRDAQPRRQAIRRDGLVVKAVDLEVARVAQDRGQARAIGQLEMVAGHRRGRVGGALVPVEVLHQRAPGEDVDGLQAAADAEDRHLRRQRRPEGLVLQRVAPGLGGTCPGWCLAVAARIDVRPAGEEQSVHGGERLPALGRRCPFIKRHRHRSGPLQRLQVAPVLEPRHLRVARGFRIGEGSDDAGPIHVPIVARQAIGPLTWGATAAHSTRHDIAAAAISVHDRWEAHGGKGPIDQ